MNQYQQDHGNAPEQVKGRFLVFVIILILMFAYLFVGLANSKVSALPFTQAYPVRLPRWSPVPIPWAARSCPL